jgi:2-polyprenyl-6-methoxyphenol hydroxylase-like FAD-dependent oxidoreductase
MEPLQGPCDVSTEGVNMMGLHFGWAVTGLKQDLSGVRLSVSPAGAQSAQLGRWRVPGGAPAGDPVELQAQYVVAADGANSGVR